MKDKIMEVYNNYLQKYPYLQKHNVILMIEGLGNYNGKAIKDITYHPKGRMGAIFATITRGELHFTTSATTLPDLPMNNGEYNDGTPTPTLKAGVYKVYSTMHHSKYPAMEVGLGNEGVPVIRKSGPDTSSGINIHKRPLNDYSKCACSAGCPNVLDTQFSRFLEYLGITKSGKYQGSGRFIGYLIVDRSFIGPDLQIYYKELYSKYYSYVFNTRNIPIDIHNHWAKNNIIEALEEELMKGYPDGTFKPDQPVTRAELATAAVRLLRKVGR